MERPKSFKIINTQFGEYVEQYEHGKKEGYNKGKSDMEKWMVWKLDKIQYAGMPKPTSYEECSVYYSRSLDQLISELKEGK